MTYVGIVGSESAKFNPMTEARVRTTIRSLLEPPSSILVSGRCPLGGVDIWAEEEAHKMDRLTMIYPPTVNNWSAPGGFRDRNINIAHLSQIVHVIVPAYYLPDFTGLRFDGCYHCNKHIPKILPHVKSGGCWTAWLARSLGKHAVWHVVDEDKVVTQETTL